MTAIYDKIGESYSMGRREDPIILESIHGHLTDAQSIINIGAGTGSYEPQHACVQAIEPSLKMINQRPSHAAPCEKAMAESLPFENERFSHAMTVLSMHHWTDQSAAFREIKRVIRTRFVALTWDPASEPWWLVDEYFPEFYKSDGLSFPSREKISAFFPGAKFYSVPIPSDCRDGFLAAYWARPHAYLNPAVRSCISSFAKHPNAQAGLKKLDEDLRSGEWQEKYGHLLAADALDAGYVLVVWDK